jgi:hypothetical protein
MTTTSAYSICLSQPPICVARESVHAEQLILKLQEIALGLSEETVMMASSLSLSPVMDMVG